jgi:hypothetical protein
MSRNQNRNQYRNQYRNQSQYRLRNRHHPVLLRPDRPQRLRLHPGLPDRRSIHLALTPTGPLRRHRRQRTIPAAVVRFHRAMPRQ